MENGNGGWPPEDAWLKSFLEDPKKNLLPVDKTPLLDHHWWELLSISCNGIDEPFLTRHFAKMARWIYENPKRKPTPRGIRRFVGNWLEKESERERRFKR